MAREIDALSRQEFEHEMLQGSLAPEKVDFLCRKVAQAPEVQAQDWADFLKSEAELFATKISAARVKQVNEIYEQLRQHDFVAHDKLVPFKATIACLNEDSFKKGFVARTQKYCSKPTPELRYDRIEQRIGYYVDVLMCVCSQIYPMMIHVDDNGSQLKVWLKAPGVAAWFKRFPLIYNSLYEDRYADIWLMKEFMKSRCVAKFDVVMLTMAMMESRVQGLL